MNKCKMRHDEVRKLEIDLKKKVVLDPNSKTCRFCHKDFSVLHSLHKHDKICRKKIEYRETLVKSKESRQKISSTRNYTINITNNTSNNVTNNTLNNVNNITNNTLNNVNNIMNYDHGYEHVSIDDIIKCLKISKEKREDAIASLSRFIRHNDKNDRSIIVSNLRGKTVKAFEDGQYVTKDARHAISHRGQEVAFRLDSAKDEAGEEHHPLWRNKDFGDIESTLSMATHNTTDKEVNKMYEEVKMAIYDTNRCLEIT
jgi:hypothetical protein